jgi:hypothetical protein
MFRLGGQFPPASLWLPLTPRLSPCVFHTRFTTSSHPRPVLWCRVLTCDSKQDAAATMTCLLCRLLATHLTPGMDHQQNSATLPRAVQHTKSSNCTPRNSTITPRDARRGSKGTNYMVQGLSKVFVSHLVKKLPTHFAIRTHHTSQKPRLYPDTNTHHTSPISILTSHSHLRLDLLSGHCILEFMTKIA